MALTYVSLVVFASIFLALTAFRRYFARNPLDNVRGPTPLSILTGDMEVLFHRHKGWDFVRKLEEYGSIARVQGILGSRALFVFDPVALQYMAVKDGVQFELPSWALATNDITFGPGLLSVFGAQHRRQRKILNSVFSAGNLRKMTPMFYKLSHKDTLADIVGDTTREVDIVHWMGRAALEFVSLGGMGHSFDTLTAHTNGSAVGNAIKNLVPLMYALTFWRMASAHLRRLGPASLRRRLVNLVVCIVPDARLGKLRDVIDTLDEASRTVYSQRQTALGKDKEGQTEEVIAGKDILSIMLNANARFSPGDSLSEDELLAQLSTILFAGTDTTSNALGRVLQSLSEHPDVQEKLREELTDARDYVGQDIPYDRLMELPLLDAVCRETLRVYSPVNVIPRTTLTDVVMPLQKPILGVDGQTMSELAIPKGTLILPCFLSCNTAKDIWGEDAEEWKPERWLSPLPPSVSEARIPGVYSNLMTFGSGARACVGFRFSQLEMKVVLSVLLERFAFDLTDRKIVWNLSGVSYPTMDEKSLDPSMHLKLRALRKYERY